MSNLLGAIQQSRESLRQGWLRQLKSVIRRQDLLNDRELESQVGEMLSAITDVPPGTTLEDFAGRGWETLKDVLSALSESRASLGFSPSETAMFVLSIKPSLFTLARQNSGSDPAEFLTKFPWPTNLLTSLRCIPPTATFTGATR